MKSLNEELLYQQDTQTEYAIVEEEDTSSLTEIKEPFDPKKIDIEIRPLILDSVIKRLKANPSEIDLYPEFQRKDNIWNKTKQSQLIESVLIRLPLPAFYFDGSDDNNWLVVDGLQRLSTLKNFVITQTLVLENLEFLKHLEGLKFENLPREFQRRIEEAPITAYIIKPGTPEDVKFNIFKRINTGGEPLTPQEIRHALNQGLPAKEIAELAKIPAFRSATGNINPNRMLDRDFVNRFVAFYLTPYTEYEPDLDTFLNKGMRKLNDANTNLAKLEYDFTKAMQIAMTIFGRHAFRKLYDIEKRRKPLSKALFEVWSVALAKLNDDERKELEEKKTVVLEEFIRVMKEDEIFRNSISQATGDKTRVVKRYSTIEKLIQQILHNHAETTTN